jgi:ferredoxin
MTHQIRLDRDACEGIFACLVRDDRFVEDSDGLAAIDAETRREGTDIVADINEDIETAKQAAEACPVDAITVDTPEGTVELEASND